MAKKKDTMIIIGGKNSSNTRKLYDIASEYCSNTLICENIKNIDNKNVGYGKFCIFVCFSYLCHNK